MPQFRIFTTVRGALPPGGSRLAAPQMRRFTVPSPEAPIAPAGFSSSPICRSATAARRFGPGSISASACNIPTGPNSTEPPQISTVWGETRATTILSLHTSGRCSEERMARHCRTLYSCSSALLETRSSHDDFARERARVTRGWLYQRADTGGKIGDHHGERRIVRALARKSGCYVTRRSPGRFLSMLSMGRRRSSRPDGRNPVHQTGCARFSQRLLECRPRPRSCIGAGARGRGTAATSRCRSAH